LDFSTSWLQAFVIFSASRFSRPRLKHLHVTVRLEVAPFQSRDAMPLGKRLVAFRNILL